MGRAPEGPTCLFEIAGVAGRARQLHPAVINADLGNLVRHLSPVGFLTFRESVEFQTNFELVCGMIRSGSLNSSVPCGDVGHGSKEPPDIFGFTTDLNRGFQVHCRSREEPLP